MTAGTFKKAEDGKKKQALHSEIINRVNASLNNVIFV